MTKVIQYRGFVEASAGIIQKGFAIRKVANLKFSISRDHKPKKLKISFFRTSKAWGCAKIGLIINNSKEFKLEATKLGKNSTEIDLIQFNSVRQFDLEFRIYPIGIKKHIINFFSSFLLVNTKLLVRDSILISELFVDKKKILVFEDNNRFNFSKSDTQNDIKVRILGFFSQTFGLAEASRRTLKAIQASKTKIFATQIPYKGKHRGDEKCISVEKSLPVEKNEIRIFHFNGDHLERLILDWGPSLLECRYKIGFWHWELPEFPNDFLPWFDKVFPRMDMMQLINSIDSLISLHRSEGFGLHLAEAMAMGKAVIATNWSGNTDFMNHKNSSLVDYDLVRLEKDFGPYRRDCRWASPVLDHAVSKMKILIKNECTNDTSIKIRARNEITEIHSLKNISSIIENRINIIWRSLERIEPQTPI